MNGADWCNPYCFYYIPSLFLLNFFPFWRKKIKDLMERKGYLTGTLHKVPQTVVSYKAQHKSWQRKNRAAQVSDLLGARNRKSHLGLYTNIYEKRMETSQMHLRHIPELESFHPLSLFLSLSPKLIFWMAGWRKAKRKSMFCVGQ